MRGSDYGIQFCNLNFEFRKRGRNTLSDQKIYLNLIRILIERNTILYNITMFLILLKILIITFFLFIVLPMFRQICKMESFGEHLGNPQDI